MVVVVVVGGDGRGCVSASAGSGNRRSKQMRLPTRPTGVSNGGVREVPAWVVADSRRLALG